MISFVRYSKSQKIKLYIMKGDKRYHGRNQECSNTYKRRAGKY